MDCFVNFCLSMPDVWLGIGTCSYLQATPGCQDNALEQFPLMRLCGRVVYLMEAGGNLFRFVPGVSDQGQSDIAMVWLQDTLSSYFKSEFCFDDTLFV